MKIFQSKYFNILLPLLFILLLFLLLAYGCLIGIYDATTLAVNAVLMFLATLIAISLPLYANWKNEQKRKEDELQMVYVSVSRYVGNEILDNIIEIEDMLKSNEKTEAQMNSHEPAIPEQGKKIGSAAMWKAAAEELVASLEDKQHQSMVMSGLVAKIPDDKVGAGIRETYQKMDNLKKRLRRMTMFLDMLLNPPRDIPSPFLENQLNVTFPETIKAVKLDIKIFKEVAEKTTAEINVLLKKYGKELKIVWYEKEENKPTGGTGKAKRPPTSSKRRTGEN